MSWDAAIDEIKALIEDECNLIYTPDPRVESLTDENVGRGNYDASFTIIQEGTATPFRELVGRNPRLWKTKIRVQVGTEVETSAYDAGKIHEKRAREVTKKLLYTNFTNICQVRDARESVRLRNEKKMVWDQAFEIVYIEE